MSTYSNIGSFFESPSETFLGARTDPPWVDGSHISYVQTARQALAIIADIYAKEGRKTLLVPEYLCGSMLEGFDPAHWFLKTYRLSESFAIISEDLVGKITSPSKTVLLSVAYFGREHDNDYLSMIENLRSEGLRVVEDETHRVLGSLKPVGDVGVASLRKLLPVADGAYIRAERRIAPSVERISPSVERDHAGWEAMDQKRTGDLKTARRTFNATNAKLNSWLRPPVKASGRTISTLTRLNYHELRRRRRENGAALRSLLREVSGVRVLNQVDIPSHLVISLSDPQRIQRRLASAGIFCPIHWPQPDRLSDLTWRSDVLSIPVDHRYGTHDMERVAEQLHLAVSE